MKPLEATDDGRGCRLHLHIAPRASRTEIAGLHGDRVKLRVAAPPADGEANAAIVDFLCDELGVRKRDITWISGQTGKRKTLEIHGVTPASAADRLGVSP